MKRITINMMFLLLSTLILVYGLYMNIVNHYYGILLIFLFIIYIYYLFKYFLIDEDESESEEVDIKYYNIIYLIAYVFLGFTLVSFGSDFFIKGIIGISNFFGYDNNLIVSMTLVAVGTSLPELVTSVIAIQKGESKMAVGNIIGSNIINILLVIGVCSMVSNSFIFDFNSIKLHLIILLVATLALIFITLIYKKINRAACFIFISLYIIFIYINFI